MWEWVMILLCDLVKAMEVYAETKRAIFLACKEHRCSMGRRGGTDEAGSQVLEREYRVPRGGWVPSLSSILRSYSQCGVRVLALLLLNMSANSWYNGGMAERSTGSEVVAAQSSHTQERLSRLKVTEPSRRAALAKAEGLRKSMSGA